MGLGMFYGAGNIERGMRERILERLKMQQAQQEMDLATRGATRADKALEAQIEQNRLAREALDEQRNYQRGQTDLSTAINLSELTPPGRLPADSPIAGRLKLIGAVKPVDERPEVTTGPLLPGDTGAALPAGYEKLPTAAQQATATTQTRLEQNQALLEENRRRDDERAVAAAKALEEDRRRREEDRREDNRRQMMVLGVMQQNAGTTAEKTALQNQINELKLRSAQDDRASARVITEDTMATLQSLKDHPGFDSSIGFYELRKGLTPESRAFNAKLTQAINSLALPNLGALKGPMSDKDILFIKNISSRLQETRVDPEDYKAAIDEAVKFLKRKLEITADTPPGSDASDPLGLRKK